jgi:PadR family transcriptional regulator PadR
VHCAFKSDCLLHAAPPENAIAPLDDFARCRYYALRGSETKDMPNSLEIDQWSTQLRKGLAELCVLAAVERLEEAYGYQLVQFLTEHDGLSLTESTVYPLLARLAREGHLSVTSTPSPSGPPRRYYRITAGGRRSLAAMSQHWTAVVASIQKLVDSNSSPEK